MDCSKCVFAISDSSGQIGCEANRLQKLQDKGKAIRNDGESYFKLSQFCNLYRESDTEVKEARDQVSSSFGVVIFDNVEHDNLQAVYESLNSIIKAINCYNKEKVLVIFSLCPNRTGKEIVELVNFGLNNGIQCEAIAHRFLYSDSLRETEAFNKVSDKSFLSLVESGESLKESTFKDIDRNINDDLDQITCFQSNNTLLILAHLVRSQYFNFTNYRSMAEEIKNFCQSKNVLGVI